MNSVNDNPLLDWTDLPQFDRFSPVFVAPALDQLLADARDAMRRVTASDTPADWAHIVQPLEQATERLARAWGVVRHLNSVADSAELREVYSSNLARVTQFWTELGSSELLFEKYKALAAGGEYASLSPPRRRIIDNALRDFRLGGAELKGDARERFIAIQQELAQLSQKFAENVLDATNAFELLIDDDAMLDGLPADAVASARAEAQAENKAGYKFTLRFPSYLPVMQYARRRDFREQMYRAYVTRASEFGKSDLDNSALIDRILTLRAEEAALLGLDSFADVSLEPKMADSPAQVIGFLSDLARRARPFAERDLREVEQFAADELGLTALAAWDLPYASEQLRQRRYSFSDQEVKQYFQAPRVLDGLFGLIGRVFGVQIRADSAPVWHPDVSFHRIERDGQLIGQFYVDLYARASKRGGAWMDDARGRKRRADQSVQTPVAYLNCNFQPPIDGAPGLLRHDDVITLFHETGHGLHHLLTRIDDLAVSGINGVEWDAVELPSQFMENFCWDYDVLREMSAHVDTRAPLPRELFDKMIAARNFQSGLQMLRQVEFAMFDMRLHAESQPPQGSAIQSLLDQVRAEVAVIKAPPFNRFQHSFSHIFGGGYSAGYYSYLWAEVLSSDCFAAFEESAPNSAETGNKFLQEILSAGGSRPAIASFRAFRGRDPSIDALLRHNGMDQMDNSLTPESTHA